MPSETIADIVAEMRELAADIEAGNAVVGQTVWRNYADRIEAAAERLREDVIAETVKAAAKSAAEIYEPHIHDEEPSNAAAMREALEFAAKQLIAAIEDDTMGGNVLYLAGCMRVVANKCRAALAAPPRNCDVGTEQEQIRRWERFCQEHHEYWKPSKSLTAIQRCNCPCLEGNNCNYFIWAQMPYEEGGAE